MARLSGALLGVIALALTALACEPASPAGGPASGAPGDGVGVWRDEVGEPSNGFPSWAERVILVWTNRARSDPQTDLAGCGSACPDKPCYTPQPPLKWSYELNRSARMHSRHQSVCGMTHDSLCTLVDTIGTLYTPGTCDGTPPCACLSGACTCTPPDGGGSGCTTWSQRITKFGGSASGENVAWQSSFNPATMFYNWLWETTSSATCAFSSSNGHRWNILKNSGPGIGCGCTNNYCTQDFGSPAATAGKIIAGVHEPQTGTVSFRANWYDTADPQQALVNINGTCSAMTKERGVNAGNATYLLAGQATSGCTHYYFVFKDSGGNTVTWPDTGSFGIGCSGVDWDSTRPALGSGCSCTPSCSGKTCGDDGCGGSCGACPTNFTCQAGSCACGTVTCGAACCNAGEACYQSACCNPDCGGKVCGSDGCGGSCGTCAGSLTCDGSGQCGCTSGLTACGTECVNLQNDTRHCGTCDHPCGATEVCAAGECVLECPSGTENCSGSCADLATDPAHCGSCDHACPADSTCQASQCVCTEIECGAACCGAAEVCTAGACCSPGCAGKACGPDGCGGSCGSCPGTLACDGAGSCGCAAGLTVCGTACVNTQSDVDNCGGCDAPCTAPQVCALGVCGDACPAGTEDCSGSCADLATDPTHCGACATVCSPGATCQAGACLCPGGLSDCPGVGCTDLATDPANCGACGRACQGCTQGECQGAQEDGGAGDDGGAGSVELVGRCGCSSSGPGGGAALALLALGLVALRRRARS